MALTLELFDLSLLRWIGIWVVRGGHVDIHIMGDVCSLDEAEVIRGRSCGQKRWLISWCRRGELLLIGKEAGQNTL
jgi:hypothetical protein